MSKELPFIAAFYNCSSLTTIVIPNNVTSIGNYAFKGCNSLTIYCEASGKLSGWHQNWNELNSKLETLVPVYWAGQWSYVDGVATPNK